MWFAFEQFIKLRRFWQTSKLNGHWRSRLFWEGTLLSPPASPGGLRCVIVSRPARSQNGTDACDEGSFSWLLLRSKYYQKTSDLLFQPNWSLFNKEETWPVHKWSSMHNSILYSIYGFSILWWIFYPSCASLHVSIYKSCKTQDIILCDTNPLVLPTLLGLHVQCRWLPCTDVLVSTVYPVHCLSVCEKQKSTGAKGGIQTHDLLLLANEKNCESTITFVVIFLAWKLYLKKM